MRNTLVRILGWPATLLHGDTLVLDRWRWLKRRLPVTSPNTFQLLDVGCGTGSFTMGAARRGYSAVGLSWDANNQAVAMERSRILRLKDVSLPICDVRRLDARKEFFGRFDVAICTENIEHILDDLKLMKDIQACLKPGGMLLLTTPNYFYHPMSRGDTGPFSSVEDGSHVRRGYTPAMLQELCDHADFRVDEIGYVSHYFSQRVTTLARALNALFGGKAGWVLAAPFRVLPVLLDSWLGSRLGPLLGRPGYSITLVAYKPRFEGRCDANMA